MLDINDPHTIEITQESLQSLDDNYATWTPSARSPKPETPSKTSTAKPTPSRMDAENGRA